MATSLPVQHFNIGKIVATYGLKGDVVMKHALGKTRLEHLRVLFTREKGGDPLPWFIEEVRYKNEEEVFIKLEDIQSKEEAKGMLQKEVWLKEPDFKRYANQSAAISLLGFTVMNGIQKLGTIEEIIEQPHQVLCRIDIEGKEVLIPLHQDSLKKIDHRKKTITVQLPEGLLDIYLT